MFIWIEPEPTKQEEKLRNTYKTIKDKGTNM